MEIKMEFFKDLTGQKFGRLTVLKLSEKIQRIRNGKRDGHFYKWLCRCDCGNECVVDQVHLKSGHTVSCGCFNIEKRYKLKNLSNSKLYSVWQGIKRRCYGRDWKYYARYGGRGILMCDEWKNDFLKFHDWAMQNGYTDKVKKFECTLDRIDNDKGYYPDNCRWVAQEVQARNTRRNIWINYNDEVMCLHDACKKSGISEDGCLRIRKIRRMSPQEAFDFLLTHKYNPHTWTWEKQG